MLLQEWAQDRQHLLVRACKKCVPVGCKALTSVLQPDSLIFDLRVAHRKKVSPTPAAPSLEAPVSWYISASNLAGSLEHAGCKGSSYLPRSPRKLMKILLLTQGLTGSKG